MAIYLDHAATSFPKPPQVAEKMTEYLTKVGATVNRSVYGAAMEAELVTLSLRERLCRLLDCSSPVTHAVLTSGCTMSLNLVIAGLPSPGDHCLISAMEHNAVLRPLTLRGIAYTCIPCDGQGRLDPEAIPSLIRPNTRLVITAHASNVSGTVQDIAAVGRICREHGLYYLVDAAQSAGHLPVSFDEADCDAMALPGHKGLLGPSGIGALLLSPRLAEILRPVIAGGTGSASHLPQQPEYLPDKLEPGTPNLPGIYGWEAGLSQLEAWTVAALRRKDLQLCRRFLDGLQACPKVRLLGPTDPTERVGVFSLDFPGQDNARVSSRLEQEFGILTRCGLHCAPLAHQTLGTYPQGTVRFSFGWSTTEQDVDAALDAIHKIGTTA